MPFGLTNAPSTFHALMNEILCLFQRNVVLVFFADILISNKNEVEHREHVEQVLQYNKLVVNKGKCEFGVNRVAYLGKYYLWQRDGSR